MSSKSVILVLAIVFCVFSGTYTNPVNNTDNSKAAEHNNETVITDVAPNNDTNTTTTQTPPTTITPIPPTTTSTTTEKPTTTSPSITTDPTTTTTTEKPKPAPARRFDAPSFIGGMVLALGILAIVYVAFKFFKERTEQNYHTLYESVHM